MSSGITPKDFSFNDRLRLTWLLQWPNFRWSGFAMYRQQQLKNVRHDLICTPCPEALREQISHCPVKRTWRFLPAFVVMLLVHVSLEVCIVVNGRYHCDNDQSFSKETSDSIGPWSLVLRIFGHSSVGMISLLIPLVLFFKYRSVPCQYIFMVDIVRAWFLFLCTIPIFIFAVVTILSAATAKSYLCERPSLIPMMIGLTLLLCILSFNSVFCATNLRIGVFINQRVSPPACTGHVCPLIELSRQGKHEPWFYLVYTQLPDGSWYVTKTLR
ncbi:hypothetical protein AAVH_11960 [Aphelenchoides avenae]|nr:hypothetical protein AAVH_11960 [Aphelenchus avenae]